tara:strand:- start:53515 stop:55836 length:2322 start_codon:yes stop_codon:yes gene_type:complete
LPDTSATSQTQFIPLKDVRLTDGVFAQQQLIHAQYLQMIEPDRLLAGFLEQAGLAPRGERYGGWESLDIAGHSLGHYLSAVSQMYAATGNDSFRSRVQYIVDELKRCQDHADCGYVLPVPRKLYEDVGAGKIETSPFGLNGCWVPNYTLHKVFAGLRDAYRHCDISLALTVATAMADWLDQTWGKLSDDQIQHMLEAEHGGMNEVLADLSVDTLNPRYLKMASHYFHHQSVLKPLLDGKDQLDGLHGNTQIPKLVGLAREYECDATDAYRHAAQSFWDHVVHRRSYANGGHGESEHFFPVEQFPKKLTPYTAETCNTYNMLKLTSSLFSWEPQAQHMDFVECALLNHLLANIGQEPGEFGYFLGLGSVGVKVFSTAFESWWCCVGTGMENPSRYGELIYAHDDNALFVNLYMASTMQWVDKNLTLQQHTSFPESDSVDFDIHVKQPTELTIKLRHPRWCDMPQVSVNGKSVTLDSQPGSYIELTRTWQDGDSISLRLPMQLRLESLPHSDQQINAVMFGPTLLASVVPDQPGINKSSHKRYGEHLKARGKTDTLPPVFVAADTTEILASFRPTGDAFAEFRSFGVIQPCDLTFKPLYQIDREQYAVYFQHLTGTQWVKEKDNIRKQNEQQLAFEAATVDHITPGYQQPEVEHHVKSQLSRVGDDHDLKFREALKDGWFSYEMQVKPQNQMSLQVTYWGGEWEHRIFDILVNDQHIATQKLRTNKPGDFFVQTYAIPKEITSGQTQVTVRFNSHPGHLGARVFGLRIISDNAMD